MDSNLHGVAMWWLELMALQFRDPGFKSWAGPENELP